MSNGNGHRWSKFWWCDWQNDAALRMCSLAAQGLWMRVLCIMHEAEPIGHLTINGRPPTDRQLAALVGAPEKDVTQLRRELEEAGVSSVTSDGVTFSRRMVRDAAQSEEGREHIAKRWRGSDPNTPPNRGAYRSPKSKPNGEAKRGPISNPIRDPITRSLEADLREEPPLGPPQKRGGHSRADKPRFKAGIFQVIADEGMPSVDQTTDNVTPIDRFLALANVPRRVAR
jgi:hypothetical protein